MRDDEDEGRGMAAEIAVVRMDCLEYVHDDGGNAAKMAWAGAALQAVAESFDGDVGAEAGGINLCGVGQKESIDSGCGEFLGVSFERAGIFCEIFVGSKLFRVHEN